MNQKQDLDDILAADCPECGQRGRGMSSCEKCGSFIPMTLSLGRLVVRKPKTKRRADRTKKR